jgi:excisionase family DNA binding protein
MSDNFISLKEAAKISGLHENSLRRLLRSKEIDGYKIGWHWWVSTSSLSQYSDPIDRFLLDLRGPKLFLTKREVDDEDN